LFKQRAKRPGRPLVVALGSSRTQMGFRPAALPGDGDTLVAFNFGLVGAGPVTQLLCLRRLLDHGVRPDLLLVEVLPALLHQEGPGTERAALNRNRLGWRDWRRVGAYFPGSRAEYRRWRRAQLAAWFTHRTGILSCWAPGLLPWEVRQDGWKRYTD